MFVIELEGLRKRYPGTAENALDGLTLQVGRGEFVGLLGPNGAGKTTLLSILCGLLAVTAGRVRLFGDDARQGSGPDRGRLGLVPQDIALYPELSARENLVFFGAMAGLTGGRLREAVGRTLARVGLEEHQDRPVRTYSGGMKRRANLAAGILHEPELLVLDEPSVGVDAQSRALIFGLLRELNQTGTTLLYATHNFVEVEQLCGRVLILDGGRLIEDGSLEALLGRCPGCATLEQVFLARTGRSLRDGS
jgi:ABC-2 type transport system ATP-binding protein